MSSPDPSTIPFLLTDSHQRARIPAPPPVRSAAPRAGRGRVTEEATPTPPVSLHHLRLGQARQLPR